MVEVGTGSSGEKEIKTDWPVVSGLIAGTTKQEGRKINLKVKSRSVVLKREKRGLNGR